MTFSRFLVLSLISILLCGHHYTAQDDKKTYIVYMGDSTPNKDEISTSDLHISMLQNVVGSDIAIGSLLHSYKRSFNGFVAKLTRKEAQEIAGKEGVVSVFPSEKQKLHTTKSWDFIGFPQQVKRSTLESDIIIGVFDTGIWPESSSFDDKGFGPPPTKWKGSCQVSSNFTCNKKIIGAKYYRSDPFDNEDMEEFKSPRDSDGHGTHTASTAAGGLVSEASLSGFASGTARGGVPSARLAIYKTCWFDGCNDADILAAFDDAIADGVDVISASFGSLSGDYFKDAIAIGAFHAMRKGILTSTSAGNRGPSPMSLNNFSPWSISVAASTIDRKFSTDVRFGDEKVYQGTSINIFDLKEELFPMIYAGDAMNTSSEFYFPPRSYCFTDSLDQSKVKGKIIFCDVYFGDNLNGVVGVVAPASSGGAAMGDVASFFPVPTSILKPEDGSKVYVYLNSTGKPTASISRSKEGPNKLAPYIASFSSRGPNPITPNILKPDLAAPGVNILAAWPPYASQTREALPYNIISGTSMACPHVSAAAAYVKSFNPTWSPAAIKSSLMTTANPMSADLNPDAEFAYGSGQVNPLKAANPGLVYDIIEADYVNFLCGQGYNTKLLQIVTGSPKSSCPKTIATLNGTTPDLNYPAFVLSAPLSRPIDHVFYRTVTNVGSPTSMYKANLVAPTGLNITVIPSVISFTSLGESQSYTVRVRVQASMDKKLMWSASLVWDDGTHQVRSPIVVYLTI